MALDVTSTPSRRALLAGVAGALAATAATALERAQPAAATTPPVGLGVDNPATTVTSITNTVMDGHAFKGIASGGGTGVTGTSLSGAGVAGSTSATGVFGVGVDGFSPGGTGVTGHSPLGIGVSGFSESSTWPAVLSISFGDNTGVQGYSGSGIAPASPAKTGVYGYAAQDGSAHGVTGETTAGRGVNGIATSGTGVFGTGSTGEGARGTSTGSNGVAGSSGSGVANGVYGENTAGGAGTYGRSNVGAGLGAGGESTSGTGVQGATTTGIGVRAISSGSGTAFRAQGRVNFSTSGLTSLAVGAASKTITPGSDLVTSSLVLCTLESNQSGLAIQRVIKDTTLNTFRVYLSAAVAIGKSAKVAWFVIG